MLSFYHQFDVHILGYAVIYKAQVPDVPAAGYRSACRPKLGTEAA
jgi:hypothetical protein